MHYTNIYNVLQYPKSVHFDLKLKLWSVNFYDDVGNTTFFLHWCFSLHIIYFMTAAAAKSGREGQRMSCMSFSVFNSSQPVTMETVSWGELKTKNAVQIQVAAGVICPIKHRRRQEAQCREPAQDLWVSSHWILFLVHVKTWWFVLCMCVLRMDMCAHTRYTCEDSLGITHSQALYTNPNH